MLYSIRMRSAKGGAHEKGGTHISGAERIVEEREVDKSVLAMVHRATSHSKGKADFISLKIEKINPETIKYRSLLKVASHETRNALEGRLVAKKELLRIGISEIAIAKGIEAITNLKASMRGAMLLDSQTGERLDALGTRGVRVTKMDALFSKEYKETLEKSGLLGSHVREALILASKVAHCPNIMAELCWSDDPEYVTGYVSSLKYGYQRISTMKEKGSLIGGRIFFLKPDSQLGDVMSYLEEHVVLIEGKESDHEQARRKFS